MTTRIVELFEDIVASSRKFSESGEHLWKHRKYISATTRSTPYVGRLQLFCKRSNRFWRSSVSATGCQVVVILIKYLHRQTWRAEWHGQHNHDDPILSRRLYQIPLRFRMMQSNSKSSVNHEVRDSTTTRRELDRGVLSYIS